TDSTSPSLSGPAVTGWSLTRVPRALRRSRSIRPAGPWARTQCCGLTPARSRRRAQPAALPTTVTGPASGCRVPGRRPFPAISSPGGGAAGDGGGGGGVRGVGSSGGILVGLSWGLHGLSAIAPPQLRDAGAAENTQGRAAGRTGPGRPALRKTSEV